MTDNTNTKEAPKVEVKPVVVAANTKQDGDVLVTVEADYIENGGVGYEKGTNVWIPEEAAKIQSSRGAVRRIA